MKVIKLAFKSSSRKPHDFIGSKIRGMLGYALKDEVCINPSFKCEGCFSSDECIFYKFFEQKNITHKYRLDFDLNSKLFEFSIFLFEEAINYEDAIKNAVLKLLHEYKDIRFEKENLDLKENTFSPIVKVSFLTPLRIKKNNKFLKSEIDLLDILVSINKRYFVLTNTEFQKLNIFKDYNIVLANIFYKELTRKSNTQKTKMNFGGLMGEIVFTNIDKKSFNLLKIGEVIGVGKSTVFGLGKIKVEVLGA